MKMGFGARKNGALFFPLPLFLLFLTLPLSFHIPCFSFLSFIFQATAQDQNSPEESNVF